MQLCVSVDLIQLGSSNNRKLCEPGKDKKVCIFYILTETDSTAAVISALP